MTTSENDMLMVEVAETVGICTFFFFAMKFRLKFHGRVASRVENLVNLVFYLNETAIL